MKETLPKMRLPWSFGEPLNGKWIRRFHGLHVGSVHFLGIQVGCGGPAYPNTMDSFPRQTANFCVLLILAVFLKMFKDPRKIVFKYLIQVNIPALQVVFINCNLCV